MSAISFATFLLMFTLVLTVFSEIFNLFDAIYIWEAMSLLDIICIMMYIRETREFIIELAYGDD